MTADSVLVIGFGGPTRPDEIRPFLQNVVRGRNVPPERLEEVAHHYEAIGGSSPYNELTLAQASALERRLEEMNCPLPVYVGMRNWDPLFKDTISRMNQDGVRQCIGMIMAPHRSQTSWERYHQDVQQAIDSNGGGPSVRYLAPWHLRTGFLEAQAERIEQKIGRRRGEWPPDVPLIFVTHSIPAAMSAASGYAEQTTESAERVAALLGAEDWSVAYQSRSGDGASWLEPDINDILRDAGRRGIKDIVVAPIGFLCDHVEVLYDLDVEAHETAVQAGIRLYRAGTVGDHPRFIEMLAEEVLATARSGATG